MKKAKEYTIGIPSYSISQFDLNNIISRAQKDAIKATLKLASEKAKLKDVAVEFGGMRAGGFTVVKRIDKDSILSLKEELFKEINNE